MRGNVAGAGLEILRWAGFAGFFVASLVVGIRLVRLWSRTRELPELMIGIGVLGIGPLGDGLLTVAQLLAARPAAAAPVMLAGLVAVQVGAASQYGFVALVFHTRQRPARVAAVAATALLVVTLAGDVFTSGLAARSNSGFWFWSGCASSVSSGARSSRCATGR